MPLCYFYLHYYLFFLLHYYLFCLILLIICYCTSVLQLKLTFESERLSIKSYLSNPKLGLALVIISPFIWLYHHKKKNKLIIETINAKNKIILQYWSMYLIHRTQTYYILQRNQQALESNNLSKAKKNHWYWINRYHIGKARYQCFEKSIKHIFLDCNNSIFCVDCLRGHE